MKKQHNEEPLSEDAELLIRYLEQYTNCKDKQKRLEIRRKNILREFDHPLTGINYDGMPKGNTISVGSAALAYRLDEIDSRILQQQNRAAKLLLDVMNVLEFLPENELERDVLEARYIDCYPWNKTCAAVHLSRSAAYRYLKDGINQLLTFKKVQKIVEEYKAHLIDEGVCF